MTMAPINARLGRNLAELDLLSLDVDGVLSDGKLYYAEDGTLLKCFCARDGYGIRALQEKGVTVALISGRNDPQLLKRARELNIARVIVGCADKAAALRGLCDDIGCSPGQAGHMGDDLPDIPAMRIAGVGAAPVDAHSEVIACADWVSAYPGGAGAVRELCDLVVTSRTRR